MNTMLVKSFAISLTIINFLHAETNQGAKIIFDAPTIRNGIITQVDLSSLELCLQSQTENSGAVFDSQSTAYYPDSDSYHVRLSQSFNGLPVIGGDISYHQGKEFNKAFGEINLKFPKSTPLITDNKAIGIALQHSEESHPIAHDSNLVYKVSSRKTIHLAYEICISVVYDRLDAIPVELIYVDAQDGSLIQAEPLVYKALVRKVYDLAGGGFPQPGTLVRDNGTQPTLIPEVDAAYDNMGICYDYYDTKFSWLSFDNFDTSIDSYVNAGGSDWEDNAGWYAWGAVVLGEGDGIDFDNFAFGLDIMAHEFTHGVTASSSGLVYNDESGALNESISDVFGAMIELHDDNQIISSDTWALGEDVYITQLAFRDISNPSSLDSHLGDPFSRPL